jgi:flagellar biosynthesis protein FlhB
MDKRKIVTGLIILIICVSFYVAISTFIVYQAMQWNFETIQRNPLSMETVTSTFVTAYSIIVWTIILLLFAIIVTCVVEILLQSKS